MANTQNTRKNSKKMDSAERPDRYGEQQPMQPLLKEALLILFIAVMVFIQISVFGFGGFVGAILRHLLFGMVGIIAYVIPPLAVFIVFFVLANTGQIVAKIKVVAMLVILISLDGLLHVMLYGRDTGHGIFYYYSEGARTHNGGGLIGAVIGGLFKGILGTMGSYIFLTVLMVIGIIFITERSLLKGLRSHGQRAADKMAQQSAHYHEQRRLRKEKVRRQRELEQEAREKTRQIMNRPEDELLNQTLKDVVSGEGRVPERWQEGLTQPDDHKTNDSSLSVLPSGGSEPEQSEMSAPIPVMIIEEDEERPLHRPVIHLPETEPETEPETMGPVHDLGAVVLDERPAVREIYPEEEENIDRKSVV